MKAQIQFEVPEEKRKENDQLPPAEAMVGVEIYDGYDVDCSGVSEDGLRVLPSGSPVADRCIGRIARVDVVNGVKIACAMLEWDPASTSKITQQLLAADAKFGLNFGIERGRETESSPAICKWLYFMPSQAVEFTPFHAHVVPQEA